MTPVPSESERASLSIPQRKLASVFPDPVGAQISVCSPLEIASQPPACAGVGPSKEASNQRRTGGLNGASGSDLLLVFASVANPPILRSRHSGVFDGSGERWAEAEASRLERTAHSPVKGSEVGTGALSSSDREPVGEADAESPTASREAGKGPVRSLNANSKGGDRLHRSPEVALVLGRANQCLSVVDAA